MIKKLKNKKSMIAGAIAACIVVIGGTFALFFSNTSINNIFNLGNFNVVMNESITSPDNWMPGEQIAKTITATNNGNIQAAFRVKITESWKDSGNNDITSNVPSNAVTINFINNKDWSYNSNDGYYYYKWIIKPGETTSSIISGVTLNVDLMGSSSCQNVNGDLICTNNLNGLAGAEYTVTFQKETVDYTKYQQFWDTNQEIVEYVSPLYSLPEGRNDYNLQVGDEICINRNTTECFNFIRYDGNNIVMLSKWNLKVGDIYDSSSTLIGSYSSDDDGYGLQSSEARGYVANQTKYGTVEFSKTGYWAEGSIIKSKYGSVWDDNNIYDSDYDDATGNNYSVAYYVENYKDKLEQYGVTVKEARLLTYSEATTNVGCSDSTHDCPSTNGFIINTTFWFGSAYSNSGVWITTSGGVFGTYGTYSFGERAGVRPVIAVSKSDVNNNVDDANKYNPVSLPSGRTKDNLQVGDEVCINGDTTECFNFYGYDGNNVKLLSKWNLKVGKIYDSSNTETGTYSSSDTGYGLQSSEAKGYVDGQNRYGTVAFSATSYWGSSGLKPKYGSSYPADVYDTDYKTAPDFSSNGFLTTGYSIAYYVEEYKKVLEDYGVIVGDARLLTYSEATSSSIGCSESSSSCPDNGFIRNTSFWLGTARSTDYLWIVRSDGYFRDGRYYASNSYNRYGVRPVIVISKDAI